MAIPFEPQPLDELRERYGAGVGRVFDYDRGTPLVRPGELRACVFDFEDGIRMVVSRDKVDGEVFLHVSASVVPGFYVYSLLNRGRMSLYSFLRLCEERFARLSGDAERLEFCGLSQGKGVPHWRRPDDPLTVSGDALKNREGIPGK